MSSRVAWQCHAQARRRLLPGCQFAILPQHLGLLNRTTQHHQSRRSAHSEARARALAPEDEKLPQKSTLLNPPASTRPPILTAPDRSEFDSTPKYLFKLGKAYLKFYKDGLKSVFVNRRLLKEKLQRTPADDRPSIFKPAVVPKSFSRADWVLMWRVRHDLLRLPFFGLMLVVIGEFTALVVLYVDGVVPYVCRIPKQVATGLRKAEDRRREAFDELEAKHPHGVLSPQVNERVARKHVLKSLHMSGVMWDRLGFVPPGMWKIKGTLRMAFLQGDDKNIIEDGGPTGLDVEELRIACAERGIDVVGKSATDLRSCLGDWLRLTAAEDVAEQRRRITVLLMTRYACTMF